MIYIVLALVSREERISLTNWNKKSCPGNKQVVWPRAAEIGQYLDDSYKVGHPQLLYYMSPEI